MSSQGAECAQSPRRVRSCRGQATPRAPLLMTLPILVSREDEQWNNPPLPERAARTSQAFSLRALHSKVPDPPSEQPPGRDSRDSKASESLACRGRQLWWGPVTGREAGAGCAQLQAPTGRGSRPRVLLPARVGRRPRESEGPKPRPRPRSRHGSFSSVSDRDHRLAREADTSFLLGPPDSLAPLDESLGLSGFKFSNVFVG